MHVLVIDDESITRRVVAHTLKAMDIETLQAESGTEAIEVAREQSFALALVDINLPDMDGFTLVGELKKLPHLEGVPMVLFTARNHPGDEAAAEMVGADGFFYKPFSTQELREMVTKLTS